MRALCLVMIPLFICSAAAQQHPCSQAIPVNVVVQDGRLVRQLGADGFVARNKNGPARILSLTTDRGPRRVVFVVENGKSMPAVARKIESVILSTMLSNARAEDSFALLTVRGPRNQIPFGVNAGTLKTIADELENPPKGKRDDNGVLDALLESSSLFDHVQAGDSLVLLTMGLESPHSVSFAKVRTALAKDRIRVFGCLLGQFIAGYIQSMPLSMAMQTRGTPDSVVSPNRENAFALARDSGGFVFYEPTTTPWKEYKLTEDQLKRLKYLTQQTYKAIIEYYLVEIESPGAELTIDLADSVRAQVPTATTLYPRLLPDCSAIANDKVKP